MEWKPQSRRPCGRPRKIWFKGVKHDLKSFGNLRMKSDVSLYRNKIQSVILDLLY